MAEIGEIVGAQKVADLQELAARSVQVREDTHIRTRLVVWQIAASADEAPAWWSERRDRYLRGFWPSEAYLAGAIYALCARNSALTWRMSGPPRSRKRGHDLMMNSQFGQGDEALRMLLTLDLLTQDNGCFMEVIRPARVMTNKGLRVAVRWPDENDDPAWWILGKKGMVRVPNDVKVMSSPKDLPIGLAHLDAGRCMRTGDDEYPVLYTDMNGHEHKLAWYQVVMFNDMPSASEKMNGVGYCAVTRALRLAQTLRDQQIYKGEKISGRFTRAIHLTNVSAEAINDAIDEANAAADSRGLTRYVQPTVVDTLDPNATPAVVTIELASMPDGYDEEVALRWYIAGLALDLGVDYSFLAPLPGGNLGTATQIETMERTAKGRSSRLFMARFAHAMNNKGILPKSVEFEFTETDPDEELDKAMLSKTRAEERKIRIESGEITVEVARQIAADAGDLDEKYLVALGSENLTPSGTTEGEASPEAEQEQAREVERQTPLVDEQSVAEKAAGETGAMVALFLPQLAHYAVDGGLSVEDLHVTILFLGDTADANLKPDIIERVIDQMVSEYPPITGTINGFGRFENQGESVLWLHFDSQEIFEFRADLIKRLESLGVEFPKAHGFTPHVTLAYDVEWASVHIGNEIVIADAVTLAWGDKREEFRFRSAGEKGGAGSGHYGHAGRPGTVGGSAPAGAAGGSGLSPAVSKAIGSAVTDVHEYGVTIGAEMDGEKLIAIGPDGKQVGDPEWGIGEAFVTREMHQNASVLVHNHPSSCSFSGGDVSILFNPGTSINHVIAVGHDGTLYRLSVTPRTVLRSNWTPDDVFKLYDGIARGALLTKYKGLVDSGKMPRFEAMKGHSHETMIEVAKRLGLDYTREMP